MRKSGTGHREGCLVPDFFYYRIKLIIKEMAIFVSEAFHFIRKCPLWISYCFCYFSIGDAFRMVFPDSKNFFRIFCEELFQPSAKIFQQIAIGRKFFWKGSRIWNKVHEGGIRSTIITKNGGIQGFGWRNVEFAVEAVAVAQPPFAARTEAFSAILHPLAKSGAPSVVLCTGPPGSRTTA